MSDEKRPIQGQETTGASVERALVSFRAGDSIETERWCRVALRELDGDRRDHALAWQLLGLIAQRNKDISEAVQCLSQAVALRPDVPELQNDLSDVLRQSGQAEKAMVAAQHAIRLKPNWAAAHGNLGLAQHVLGDKQQAELSYRRAAELAPDEVGHRFNLGNLLRECERYDEAADCLRDGLSLQPNSLLALNTLGVVLHKKNESAEAENCFQQALTLAPAGAPTHFNYGNLLCDQQRWEAALQHFDVALKLRPDYVPCRFGIGAALMGLKRFAEAIDCLQRAVAIRPDSADAAFHLGTAYVEARQFTSAVAAFERALELRPEWAEARGHLVRDRAEICDWRNWQDALLELQRQIEEHVNAGKPSPLPPIAVPALPLPLRLLRPIAVFHARAIIKSVAASGLRNKSNGSPVDVSDRLRVGYLSYDFRDHPVGHSVRTMFGHHERNRFEVFTYSYGPDDGSDYRQGVVDGSEHFVDLHARNASDIARQIDADGINVLVDLMGYSGNALPPVLAYRPAPILVHYLGYPSTLGGLVDYFITDSVATPLMPDGSSSSDTDRGETTEFAEALVYLPDTFFVADDQQPVGEPTFNRAQCQLPKDGFVFCNFNSSYKIQPEIFDVWMRILTRSPGAVLWLSQKSPEVIDNLRREAEVRRVDPDRIVFAERLPAKSDHLARHGLADLFLDTPVYNGHTTAMDALWAGLPLLTCAGERFTQRVAASILTSASLDELIVNDLEHYEELAVALAGDRRRCERLRADWQKRRALSALFDTKGRVRQLERAYVTMWERYQAGMPLESFSVSTGAGGS